MNINLSSKIEAPELPILPLALYEHLEEAFNIDYLLSKSQPGNNDERIGYIRGVRDMLAHCRLLAHINEDKE